MFNFVSIPPYCRRFYRLLSNTIFATFATSFLKFSPSIQENKVFLFLFDILRYQMLLLLSFSIRILVNWKMLCFYCLNLTSLLAVHIYIPVRLLTSVSKTDVFKLQFYYRDVLAFIKLYKTHSNSFIYKLTYFLTGSLICFYNVLPLTLINIPLYPQNIYMQVFTWSRYVVLS